MTPTARRACIDVLGWTQRGFARLIGYDESTVRRWFRAGYDPPPGLDPWLERRAEGMRSDPPPFPLIKRPPGRPPMRAAVALLAVVALVGLAACAPPGGYYEDPEVQAARINSSTALIGLGTSLMFAPRYQPGLVYPTHQRCYRMGPEVHCDGW